MLKLTGIDICCEDKKIVSDLSLTVKLGEMHAVMGPNGSGKTSLAMGLAGHPNYKITKGAISIDNQNITFLSPEKRAKLGLFISFQNPVAVEGVSLGRYLVEVKKATCGKKTINIGQIYEKNLLLIKKLQLSEDFLDRPLNYQASGGEKKKVEVLSLINLRPRYIILDEVDSGLDIDSLRLIADIIKQFLSKNTGLIVITHYQRILKHIKPDFVHILKKGKIVANGDYKLAAKVERRGYAAFN